MDKELLSYVFEKSGIAYLSDLKFIKKEVIFNILENVDINDYSLKDWREFYLYIIGEETKSDNREEIKKELIKKMT